MKSPIAIAAALLLAACGGGGGGGNNSPAPTTPTPPATTYTDPVTYSSAAQSALPSGAEITAVTKHSIVVGGNTLNYTATAGHLNALSIPAGTPEAAFFYVAYTLDGANPATRPVTFFYNGGPGSATVWLHLGSFGPKRLVTNAPSTTTASPFAFVDNAESLLDTSDLVFIDAVATGFSEAITPYTNNTWWSVDADAGLFRDFVIRYIAVNNRQASPKFLFGESYGTPRSAVLANLLESAGTSLTGVVLQSSILNYNSNCGVTVRVTISCYAYLPSYGAIGAWLSLVNPPQPVAQLPAYMDTMRTVARTQYDPAVAAYLKIPPTSPSGALVAQLNAQTGMSAANWSNHFNMDDTFFHDNLVPGSVIGYYDGRMVAANGTFLASQDDPSSTMYDASFSSTIVTYLANDLHYTTPSTYVISSNAINAWNFSHAGQQLPDTIPDLAAAMAHNPKLKVFSANGYYDIVTPFYNTENDLTRLGYPNNALITTHFYQGGHMTYLDDVGRTAEKADVAAFYRAALSKREIPAGASTVPAPPAAVTPAPVTMTMPAPVFETTVRDPKLPPSMAKALQVPPTTGTDLAAQVDQRLRALFDAAPASVPGRLTRDEARAAGLGYIAGRFDAIDTARRGWVTFDDVKRYMRTQGATLLPD
jgi:carboxypeptidase C (cathepsin A)